MTRRRRDIPDDLPLEGAVDADLDDNDSLYAQYIRDARRHDIPRERAEELMQIKTGLQKELYAAEIEFGLTYEQTVRALESLKGTRGKPYFLERNLSQGALERFVENRPKKELDALRVQRKSGITYKEAEELLTDYEPDEFGRFHDKIIYSRKELQGFIKIWRRTHHDFNRTVRAASRGYLRLAISIAKRYQNNGLDFIDLIQEANEGLLEGCVRFDADLGLKPSTYLSHWIRHKITRALADTSRTIRLPVHMIEAGNKVFKFVHNYRAENCGKKPTNEEIAEATELDVKKVQKVFRYTVGNPLSLDQPMGEEDFTLYDILEDESVVLPYGDYQDESAFVAHVMRRSGLLERERYVLEHRLGFNGREAMTLREIGELKGVSRERIRQIESMALDKLKKNPEIRRLAEEMGKSELI